MTSLDGGPNIKEPISSTRLHVKKIRGLISVMEGGRGELSLADPAIEKTTLPWRRYHRRLKTVNRQKDAIDCGTRF